MSDNEEPDTPHGVTISEAPKGMSMNDVEAIRSTNTKKSKSKQLKKDQDNQPNLAPGQLPRKKVAKKLKTKTLGKKEEPKKTTTQVESDFKIEGYPIIVAAINNGILTRNHIHGIFQGFGIGPIHEHPSYCIIEMTSKEDQERALKKNRAEYKKIIVLVDKYDISQEDPKPPESDYVSRYSHRDNMAYVDDMPSHRPQGPSFQIGSRRAPPSYGYDFTPAGDRPDRGQRSGYAYEGNYHDRDRSYGGHNDNYGAARYGGGSRYDDTPPKPTFLFGAKKQDAPTAPIPKSSSAGSGFGFGGRRQQPMNQADKYAKPQQQEKPVALVSRNPFADLNDD